MKHLQYPIGPFNFEERYDKVKISSWINSIESLPRELEETVLNIQTEDLNLHYRPGSWTIKQVIHHLAESHMYSYFRYKLALTEDNPEIKSYSADAWSSRPEANNNDVQTSVQLLNLLHKKWIILLKSMNLEDFKRTIFRPDKDRKVTLAENTALYAWHGKHHLEQIKNALKFRENFPSVKE